MVERALRLYRLYCIFNLVWYGVLILGSVTLVLLLRSPSVDTSQVPKDQMQVLNGSLIFLSAISWVFLATTLFLMKPVRTHKYWAGAFVNICVGISTCCLAPLCIPLAIMWNSKDVRDHFTPASFDLD